MRLTINVLLIILLWQLSASAQPVQGKLLSTWSDTTLESSRTFNNTYNEVWGYTANNREYAIIGTTLGTHIFDITDPTQPNQIQVVLGGTSGREIIHRDYHDYNGYLYAVSDEGSNSTLQIMDLSFLPDSVSVVYDSKELIRRSHNIFIDTSSAIMYCCGTQGDNHDYIPLRLFDLSDPTDPVFISEYNKLGPFLMGDVHDAYVRKDTAYLNCGTYGFAIADFSDPLAPVALSTLKTSDYPQAGYNHSGWLSEDGNTYAMADETWNKDVKLLDLSDFPAIDFPSTVNAENPSVFSIPHNQIIHGDYLYVAYYYDGLQVYDISDIENPQRVMHYPTSQLLPKRTYEGAWGVYPFLPSGTIIVSDMQEGLFLVDGIDNTLSNAEDESAYAEQFTLSPNPSSGSFRIITDTDLSKLLLSLHSTDGTLISILDNNGRYNIKLAAGVYYIRIQKHNQFITKKLVIGL